MHPRASGVRQDDITVPTACIVHDDGTVWIYYFCADVCVRLATAKLDEIIAFTKDKGL